MRIVISLAVVLTLMVKPAIAQDLSELTKEMKTVFSEGFSTKSLKLFDFSNPKDWMIVKNGKSGNALKCKQITNANGANYIAGMALLKDLVVGDCVVEFDFLQRGQNFAMRDLCFIFNYTDSANYQYAQAASEVSKTSHNFFINTQGNIARNGLCLNEGMIWKYEDWQQIVFVRKKENGKTQLFVDNELVLETEQDNFLPGKIGFGSYGSEIKIDNLKVWIPKE